MGAIRDLANSVYVDGPSTAATDPIKSEIRSLFGAVDSALDLKAAQADLDDVLAIATSGIRWTSNKITVRSTANVNIANGLENGDTLNGVTLSTGQHVFLGSQSTPSQNGIYTVVSSGAASRATFADSAAELAFIGFVVAAGTVGAGEQWTLNMAASSINLGVTALAFSPYGIPTDAGAEVIAARGTEDTLGDRLDATDIPVARLDYIINCPLVTIDGRLVQPTDLSFDLKVLAGVFVDDGTIYPSGGGVGIDATRIEKTFPTYSGAPSSLPQRVYFAAGGQSNATGKGDVAILTPSALYSGRVLTFNAGPKSKGSAPGTDMTSMINLIEDTYIGDQPGGPPYGESIVSGLCYGFLERAFIEAGLTTTSMPKIVGHVDAVGGQSLSDMATTYYTYFQTALARAIALKSGDTFAVAAFIVDGHENQQGTMAQATWQSNLRSFYNQVISTVITATSQAWNPIMITKQLSWGAQPTANTPSGSANTYPASVALGSVAEQGSGLFVAFPDYCVPFSGDGIHRSAVGHKMAGRYYARCAERVLVGKKDWRGLSLKSSWIEGGNCYVKLDVPVQPIRVDYTNVGTTTQAGFKLTDSSGDLPISSVATVAGDTLKLTLGRARNGAVTLRYGLDYLPLGSFMAPGSAGGNIRDSDTETIAMGGADRLFANWLLAGTSTPMIQEA